MRAQRVTGTPPNQASCAWRDAHLAPLCGDCMRRWLIQSFILLTGTALVAEGSMPRASHVSLLARSRRSVAHIAAILTLTSCSAVSARRRWDFTVPRGKQCAMHGSARLKFREHLLRAQGLSQQRGGKGCVPFIIQG